MNFAKYIKKIRNKKKPRCVENIAAVFFTHSVYINIDDKFKANN